MKTTIYALIFTLLMISCNSEETEIKNSDLVGTWNWTNTSGGISYFQTTPLTTGKTIHLTLAKNYTYSIVENGNIVTNGTYELTLEKSIYSGTFERYISLQSLDQESVGIVKNGIVTVFQNQTLDISDNHYDGFGSGFIKIK